MADLIRYVDTDVVGGLGDGTSWANAYATLSAWNAAEAKDLTVATEHHICYVRGATADTTVVNMGTWTNTTASFYVDIICTDPHSGSWTTGKYRLAPTAGYSAAISAIPSYTRIYGLQISETGSGSYGINIPSTSTTGILSRCIVRKCPGYNIFINGDNWKVINCGSFGGANGIWLASSSSGTVGVNCSIANASTYGIRVATYGTSTFINCYAGGSGTADFSTGGASPTLTNCFSSDETLSTSHADLTTGSPSYFTNVTADSEDLHININSVLYGAGTDASAYMDPYMDPDEDVDGVSRPIGPNWDVGYDECSVTSTTSTTTSTSSTTSTTTSSTTSSTTASASSTTSTTTTAYPYDTYYCDINQAVNGDGSIGSPWNSLANASIGLDALADDGAGDTLILIAGTYDAFADNSVWEKPRTDWLTIQPYTGDEVIIATPKPVEILRSSLDSIKLKFVGLRLIPTNPDPLPKDTHNSKNYTANRVTANIANCQDVTFQDCEIKGLPYRWLTHTVVNIYACKSVLVTGCKVHHAAWVLISATHGCCDVTIQGNVLWDDGLGEWLKFEGPNTGQIIVERNLMIDSQSPYYLVSPRNANEPYSPYLAVNSTEYHPGSGIVIKSDKAGPTWDRFIIRKNIMDGPSNTSMVQHLYTYEQWGGYDSMTIENNLFIECTDARFHDLYCADADHSVLIRNNTCAGPAIHNILSRSYLPTRYCDSYNVCTTSSGASSYQYIYSYNNLWVAQGSASPGATKDTFTSNNNLLWCPYNFSTIPAWKGANDIFMFYYTTSLHGNPNGFGDIGWTNANNAGSPTPEYDSTEDPVADIFTDWDHLDYTLSGNTFWYSSARDPLTFGDASLDPDDSLGTVDANGFILDDGPARDASHHAVGCYEAGATFGHPTRPSLPNPFNQEFDVAVDPNLSWYRGLAAVSYNVYFGTDQSLVEARDASTLQSTEQTGTTYEPPALSTSTTYYWAVDSVGSDSSIGNGVVWEFTTEDATTSSSSTTTSTSSTATASSTSSTTSTTASSSSTSSTASSTSSTASSSSTSSKASSTSSTASSSTTSSTSSSTASSSSTSSTSSTTSSTASSSSTSSTSSSTSSTATASSTSSTTSSTSSTASSSSTTSTTSSTSSTATASSTSSSTSTASSSTTTTTTTAPEVEEYGITSVAFQKNPDPILWATRTDGTLLSLTYEREQNVLAWARHPMKTGDTVSSVAVIPGASEDEVWLVVARSIDGSTVYYLEQMQPRDFGDYQKNAWFVDSGLSYDGADADGIVTGLDHLEGEEVVILVDGAVAPRQTVASGSVNVGSAITSKAIVGLPFRYTLQPMRFDLDLNGTTKGTLKRFAEVVISFFETLNAEYGEDTSSLLKIDWRTEETYGSPPALYSGDKVVTHEGGFSVDDPLVISSDDPTPCTVLALIPRVNPTGR